MKNKDVILRFANSEDAVSHTGSLKSKNNILYSYSLKIAKNLHGIFLVYPANAKNDLFYSNTTSKHVSALLNLLPRDKTFLVFNQFELEE